jgi:hypothetical protein
MRYFAFAALSAALIASPAFASNDADGKAFTLKVEGQGIPVRGTIQTDVVQNLDGSAAPASTATSSAQPPTAQAAPATPPAASGMPQIAGASTPGQGASAPAAAPPAATEQVTTQAAAPAPAAAPGQVGLVPGEPAKVYTTLAAAAEAGVDPLNERKISVSKPKAAEEDAQPGFDWRDPGAYLSFVQANEKLAKMGGFGLLGAILLVWLVRRRRA